MDKYINYQKVTQNAHIMFLAGCTKTFIEVQSNIRQLIDNSVKIAL